MKLLLLAALIPTLLFAEVEEAFDIDATKQKVIDQRENYFQTSTPYKITPNVNPITGDLIEEEVDLVIAGSEPLSVRRFYNHTAIYDPRYGGWRYNPESYLVANFEWPQQECFAAAGELNGGIASFKASDTPYHYTFNAPTEYAHFNPSGQTHPLNTKITYIKNIDRKKKLRFSWQGEVVDGSGNRRYFASGTYHWLSNLVTDVVRRGRDVYATVYTPNVWTPYQLPIYEERKPNGNIICYNYVRWKKNKLYPVPSLLNSIVAYNSDKTKILSSIGFHYNKDKNENVYGLNVVGSDGRHVSIPHHGHGATPVLYAAHSPNKPTVSYGYQGQRINCVARPEGRVITTEYNGEGKVSAQYAPVGPNGEMHPIGRYYYWNSCLTQVMDAEGNLTDYHFNQDKQLHAVVALQYYRVYRIDRMVWDPANGNLLRKTIEDATGTPVQITEYKYDKNHNPIEEKIGDGIEWYTTTRTFSDDGFNLKLSESDRDGKITRYSYRPNTNLLTAELICAGDRIAKRTFHTYDDCAVCIKTIIDDGSTIDPNDLTGVTYRTITEIQPKQTLPCFGLPEIVQEKTIDSSSREILLKKVIYTYTHFGQVLKEEHYDAEGAYRYTIQNGYDERERLNSTTDPLGHQTFFKYDQNNNLISITGPKPDQHKEITYDKANRPIRITDRQSDGTFLSIEKRYDKLGQVITEIDPCGNTTHFAYDILGRMIVVHHPDGAIEHREYDTCGNLTKEIDAEGHVTQKTYNYRGQPLSIVHPDGAEEHFTYYPQGALATHIDKSGSKMVYTYDIFDHPIRAETYAPGLLKTTTAAYTPFQKISETDGEGTPTIYTCDFAGRKIAEQTDTKKVCYFYDSMGFLTRTEQLSCAV